MKKRKQKDDILLFSTASPLFFKISATVTTVAIAATKTWWKKSIEQESYKTTKHTALSSTLFRRSVGGTDHRNSGLLNHTIWLSKTNICNLSSRAYLKFLSDNIKNKTLIINIGIQINLTSSKQKKKKAFLK